MEPNDDLDRVLREWRVPEAPAWLEARVIARRDALRRRQMFGGTALIVGLAAALLVTIRPPAPQPAAPVAVSEESFVPVPNVLPLDSYETGRVLRMNLRASDLISAGFSLPAGDPTATVRADVLVGEDGRAHAVRLVPETGSDGAGD